MDADPRSPGALVGQTAALPAGARPRAGVRDLAARHWSALCLDLRPDDPPFPRALTLGLLGLQLLGVLALVRIGHRPVWLTICAGLLLLPLLLSWKLRRLQLMPESLAPLAAAYALLAARLALALAARLHGSGLGPLRVPEPWGARLDLDLALAFGVLWALVTQAGVLLRAFNRRLRWPALFGAAALVLALAWSGVTYVRSAARGVTASDPYAYVQMAVDLAQNGSLLHTFALAPQVARWGLPIWPSVPVGYRPPDPATGSAATVWPPGQAALLALGYRLAGESGLAAVTPLLGIGSLLALWWLGREVLRGWPAERRSLAAGAAVLVLATSILQVRNLSVPMADIASQLFSTLAVCCALRAGAITSGPTPSQGEGRGGGLSWAARGWAACAGLCLGAAFDVRYTQVLMAVPLALAWLPGLRATGSRPTSGRNHRLALPGAGPWLWLLIAGSAALLVALPVLWYHQVAFGSPFSVGSAELPLLGADNVRLTLPALARELLDRREFLYLLPFVVWGALRGGRSFRRPSVVLAAWLVAIGVFHLSYSALRARDLLSVFPVLALWAGMGIADALAAAQAFAQPQALAQSQAVAQARAVGPSDPARRGAGNAQAGAQPTGGHAVGDAWGAGGHAWRATVPLLVALAVLACLWARGRETLDIATGRPYFTTFGYLQPEQRRAFDTLAAVTPADAIVASSLNAGPVILYAGRAAVRPAYWSAAEWQTFVERALGEGRALYALADGAEMEGPIAALRAGHNLVQVAYLPLPYFSPNGGSDDRHLALYRVERNGP